MTGEILTVEAEDTAESLQEVVLVHPTFTVAIAPHHTVQGSGVQVEACNRCNQPLLYDITSLSNEAIHEKPQLDSPLTVNIDFPSTHVKQATGQRSFYQ